MSKINVDEIKVGDLVGRYSEALKKTCLGVVTDISGNQAYALWSNDYPTRALWCYSIYLTGHWKVINFEEEAKMDELKVYTGKETLQALIDRKTISWATDQYKLDGEFLYEKNGPNEWTRSFRSLDHFMTNEFTEVVTPQVGDWVKVNTKLGFTSTGLITSVASDRLYGNWNGDKGEMYYLNSKIKSYEILSPEQVSEYKREQAFAKVGRKLNEFKHGDIVYIESLAVVATVITKNNGMEEIKLHGINEAGKGYTARAHQLTPISFIEQQVDLS